MNLPTWYSTGTVSVESGGTTVTGTGSLWGTGGVDDNIMIGDLFSVPSQPLVPAVVISGVTEDGELELMWPWPGADVAAQPYIIRYVGITERSTRANRMALELMGEISAWYDVIVETDADRLALETTGSPLRAGYRVLVKDDGVIWAKASSTYGDWIGPVEFVGPVGPLPTVTVDATTTLAPGTPATVVGTPVSGGVKLAFGVPAGRGATPRGTYNPATAYILDDAVLDNGSTFIALQATTGHAPPTLPTTSNAYWQLLARKGTDGTGTGDLVGPAGAIDGASVVFDGTSGKLVRQGTGGGIATRLPEVIKTADYAVLVADAGTMLAFNKATAIGATLPGVAASNGERYRFINIGAGALTVDPNGAELVEGASTLTLATGAAADLWPNAGKTAWRAFVYSPAGDYLAKAQNLVDLPNKVAARAAMGQAWETIVKETRGTSSVPVPSLDFPNLYAFPRLRGKMFIRPTAACAISLRASITNGASWITSASYRNSYFYGILGNPYYQEDGLLAQMRISLTGSIGFGGNDGLEINFEIDRFNEGGTYAWVTYSGFAYTSTGNLAMGSGSGRIEVASSFDAFQLFPSGGAQISHSELLLEGVR